MAGRRKSGGQKLTQSDVDAHVKDFLQKGGQVAKIPKGKSAVQNNKDIK